MQFQLIEYYISRPRIARFLAAAGGNQNLASDLYLDNLLLSQAFHPLMGVLEVTLRNAINEQLSTYFNDPEWIVHQKTGFMQHASLTYFNRRLRKSITNDFLLKQVLEVEDKLQKVGKTVNAGRVIAELSLGFWTRLYDPTHSQILRGQPMQVFPQLPSNIGRSNIYRILNEIRLFRNRLSHNEPICFQGNQYGCGLALTIHSDIMNVLTWIEPNVAQWINPIDSVQSLVTQMDGKYI